MRLKMMAVSFTALALLVPTTGAAGPTAAKVVKPTEFTTWAPYRTKIVKGSRVVWKNTSSEYHTVKSWKGKWMPKVDLFHGESVGKRFRKRGLFSYRCTIHSSIIDGECSGMCGEVKVRRRY